MEIREFKARDLPDLGVELNQLNAKMVSLLVTCYGPKWSAFEDGECIGSGGVAMLSGEWLAWVATTPELIKRKLAFTKLARRLLVEFQTKYADWRQITALVATDRLVDWDWAEHFGFAHTGNRKGQAYQMVLVNHGMDRGRN